MINSKNWKAQHDRMPPGARVRVAGTVTVANPGVDPVLVKRDGQPGTLALDLELKSEGGSFIQVLCDKEVHFEMPTGTEAIASVEIFHEGTLLAEIDEILVTA